MTTIQTRLAQADKPSRELLWEAWQAINGTALAATQIGVADFEAWNRKRRPFDRMLDAEAWTSAVEMLLPTEPYPELRPGKWWWMLEVREYGSEAYIAYENHDAGIPEFVAKAKTPSLALAIACLKARGR